MIEDTLQSLGYEFCWRIHTWRKYLGPTYASNVVELDVKSNTIATNYGFDKQACDEIIKLMQAIREVNEWES